MRRLILFALLSAGLSLSVPVTAQQPPETAAQGGLRSTTLTGREVQFPGGDRIGWVEELILSPDGQVQFVVVALTASAELTAVPWAAVRFPADAGPAVLALDRQRLTEAPTFSREELIEPGPDGWQAEARNFYGIDRKETATGMPDFRQLDTDGDGQISPTEMGVFELPGVDIDARFEAADQDGDGMLDRSEFAAFREGLADAPGE